MRKHVLIILLILVLAATAYILYPKNVPVSQTMEEQGYEKVAPVEGNQITFNNVTLIDHTFINNEGNKCAGSNLGMDLSIENCKAQDYDGEDIVYYINHTWNGAQAKGITTLMMFNGDLKKASIEYRGKQNYTYTENAITQSQVNNYLVSGIINYTDLGTPDARCQMGNTNNTYMYSVTQTANVTSYSTTVYCFTSRTTVNSTAFRITGMRDVITQVNKSEVRDAWIDASGAIVKLGKGLLQDNLTYYKSREVQMEPHESVYLRLTFTPMEGSKNGKWSILDYETDYTLVQSILDERYLLIDPWYNSSWAKCRNLNVTGGDEAISGFPFYVNITYDSDMSFPNFQDVRIVNASCNNGGIELPYEFDTVVNSSYAGAWVKANLSTGVNQFSIHYGNPSATNGQNPAQVWSDYIAVYHFSNNGNDALGKRNLTLAFGTPEYRTSPLGSEFNGTGTNCIYSPVNLTAEIFGNADRSMFAIAKFNAGTGATYNAVAGFGWSSTNNNWDFGQIGASSQFGILANGGGNDYSSGITSNTTRNSFYFQHVSGTTTGFVGKLKGNAFIHTFNTLQSSAYIGCVGYTEIAAPSQASVDEFRVANKTFSNAYVNRTQDVADLSLITIGAEQSIPATVSISFNAQSPADISTTNIIAQRLNVSYDYIFSSNDGNASTYGLSWKVNSTTTECVSFLNGACHDSGYNNVTYSYNISSSFYWLLGDNVIYPATYNYDDELMESIPKQNQSISTTTQAVRVNFLNVSSADRYGFLEFYVENTSASTSPLTIFYCNSTYTTGDFTASPNCVQIASLLASTPYNHSHGVNSKHYVVPFVVNSSGSVGTVKVTSSSDIILRGAAGIGAWNVKYIQNVSRASNTRTTGNTGTTWASLNGTADAHMHQYTGNETLYYYAYGYNLNGSYFSSTERSDLLDLGGLAPSQPIVFSPNESIYSALININYTAALSPNAYNITSYNLTLVNTDGSFNASIYNNGVNLSYIWNATAVPEGYYRVQVTAKDQNNLSSNGISQTFFIDRTAPIINATSPLNGSTSTSISTPFYANVTDNIMLSKAQLIIYSGASVVFTNNATITGNSTIANINATLADGNYTYYWKAYDSVGLTNISRNATITVDLPPINGELILVVNQYPYVDLNTNYDVKAYLIVNGVPYTATDMYINITSPDATVTSTQLTPNLVDGYYSSTFLFTEEGNYNFVIYEVAAKITTSPLTGTFFVREPYYVTVEAFVDKNTSRYINKYAYVTAEFTDARVKGATDRALEGFVYPLVRTGNSYDKSVFHAAYSNGAATLKLWEKNTTYGLRIVDGQINFASSYAPANISRSYGTDIYLGKVYLNGTNTSVDAYVSDKDMHPYRWLANIILIIALVGVVIVSFMLIFFVPQYPIFAMAFGTGFTIMLIILRVAFFLWSGN